MKEGSKMVVSGWKNQKNYKSDQNKAVKDFARLEIRSRVFTCSTFVTPKLFCFTTKTTQWKK